MKRVKHKLDCDGGWWAWGIWEWSPRWWMSLLCHHEYDINWSLNLQIRSSGKVRDVWSVHPQPSIPGCESVSSKCAPETQPHANPFYRIDYYELIADIWYSVLTTVRSARKSHSWNAVHVFEHSENPRFPFSVRSVTRPYVDVWSAPWYQGYPPGSYPTIPSEIWSVGQRFDRIWERFLPPVKGSDMVGGPHIIPIFVSGRHL